MEVIQCDADNHLETMPKRIADSLKQQLLAIVQSHDVYAVAKNTGLAYKWLRSIEQSAKIKRLAKQV
jgi:ribulose-5-phosphate 4-epimerase/fuculose-1-phosphate aldolase